MSDELHHVWWLQPHAGSSKYDADIVSKCVHCNLV